MKKNPMKFIVLAVVLGLVSPHSMSSGHPDWMNRAYEVENPESFAYYVAVGSACPVVENEIRYLAETIIVRSRLSPVSEWSDSDRLYLSIEVSCIDRDLLPPIFMSNIHFQIDHHVPIQFRRNYGQFGTGDNASVNDSIRDSVERAVTDFIRVNFDL